MSDNTEALLICVDQTVAAVQQYGGPEAYAQAVAGQYQRIISELFTMFGYDTALEFMRQMHTHSEAGQETLNKAHEMYKLSYAVLCDLEDIPLCK